VSVIITKDFIQN